VDGLFEKVHTFVKTIPVGRVATYGQVAQILGVKDVRKIGWALHANKDTSCPCHRVVNKDGRVAPGYAFGGPGEQKKRLEEEGVGFKDDQHVDLAKHLWSIGALER